MINIRGNFFIAVFLNLLVLIFVLNGLKAPAKRYTGFQEAQRDLQTTRRYRQIESLQANLNELSLHYQRLLQERDNLKRRLLILSSKGEHTREIVSSEEILEYGHKRCSEVFGEQYWDSLYKLWQAESGWNPSARNRSSGAYGIPQSLPASKMDSYGDRHNYRVQINWGLDYIKARYGNPFNAYNHWRTYNWY